MILIWKNHGDDSPYLVISMTILVSGRGGGHLVTLEAVRPQTPLTGIAGGSLTGH